MVVECNLDERVDRRGTDCYKWDRYDSDVLPLPVADMDFLSPAAVLDALARRVEHGVYGYTDVPSGLIEAVQAWLADRHGWEVDREAIRPLPGVAVGFHLACHAIGEPGDGVLIQPPIYPPFRSAPGNAGRERQMAPLVLRDGRYAVDEDVFEGAITDRTRLFLLCNPHNPVGRVYERTELERMAEICLRHGIVICSDEIHCDLVYSGHRHTPLASLDPDVAAQTITLIAPSKTFNIAGLHCGFAVVENPDLRKRFYAAHGGLVPGVNLFGYTAALAAYTEGHAWLEQVLDYLEANRDHAARYVGEHMPGVDMVVPEGTFLAWLDCRGTGIEGDLGSFFLREARVALGEGVAFGPGGEGHVRLNYACTREVLSEALERMSAALRTLSQG